MRTLLVYIMQVLWNWQKDGWQQNSKKTIDYAKEHNIDTSEENEDFSTWMNEDENVYEIQSDGFFFEKGQILEAETA